ncbi:MAG: hypothetical protein RLZZ175_6 [Bacteroidota bacterium]|jgi:D-tyrosyl-tRNA(Tyr) deacylase
MIAVIQRVKKASVSVDNEIIGNINQGLLILLGVAHEDSQLDADWLVNKIVQMRIFADDEGKMNRSMQDLGADLLVVSQFTLHASTQKGNRPSFIKAAKPEIAIPLYEYFIQKSEELLGKKVQTGKFGADMEVSLVNDGPVTIIIDTANKS